MDWKAQLEGEETALTQLRSAHNTPNSSITRNGIEWFLESTDFELLTDDRQVREKAQEILASMIGSTAQASPIGIGPVIRMHYDGSKSVFRAEA